MSQHRRAFPKVELEVKAVCQLYGSARLQISIGDDDVSTFRIAPGLIMVQDLSLDSPGEGKERGEGGGGDQLIGASGTR